MAMKKTSQGEGKIEVLRGEEAQVLNDHFAKTGKYAVSDFSEDEREALDADLSQTREEKAEHRDEPASKDEAPKNTKRADSDTGGDK